MPEGYSIRFVSQMTGLSAYVIRAWEKRYDVVSPSRSDGNQRLYSESDVRRLRLLSDAVKKGHRISDVAGMADERILQLIGENSESNENNEAANLLERSVDAVNNIDPKTLEEILNQSSIVLGLITTVDSVVVPLMQRIGEDWYAGRLKIFQEHMASSVVRTFLGECLRTMKNSMDDPVAVVTTPSGQIHEMGSLVAAIAAASAGYQVLHLGADLPPEEIIQSVSSTGARLLLISVVYPKGTSAVKRDLEAIRSYLPKTCRLFLGGPSAAQFLEPGDSPSPGNAHSLQSTLASIRNEITGNE